jgi:hypothetical protein
MSQVSSHCDPIGSDQAWHFALLVRFKREDNTIEAGTSELFGCMGHCDGRMALMIGSGLGEKCSLGIR